MRKLVQLVCLVVVIVTLVLVVLALTGRIQPADPFGGCARHPGECGVRP